MNIVSFIFARGNSSGIKNKNLLKFKKTSLLGNSILQSKKLHRINFQNSITVKRKSFQKDKNYCYKMIYCQF